MGEHLIPGALSVGEVADHLGAPTLSRTWELLPTGVLFRDELLGDAACAALYADFTPSGVTDRTYEQPLPAPVIAAVDLFKSAAAAGWPSPTPAQQARLNEATWVLFRHLYRRLGE